jgi:hypothetical protein
VSRRTITIVRRYRGPLRSANGGYAAGLLARELGGAVEVTLRRPPPLETPLDVSRDGERLLLCHGDALVAEASPADPGIEAPGAPPFEAVAAAGDTAQRVGWGTAEFGECFSCGRRAEGDGLAVHPLPFGSLVAASWVAADVATEVVWAAIDCSGAYAVGSPGRGEPLLARMTARVDRLPAEGERCVVIGWPLADEGRKLHAGTALVGEGGETLAVSRQLWITPSTPGARPPAGVVAASGA